MSAFGAHSLRNKITAVLALLLTWALASPVSSYASDKRRRPPPQRTSSCRNRGSFQDRHFQAGVAAAAFHPPSALHHYFAGMRLTALRLRQKRSLSRLGWTGCGRPVRQEKSTQGFPLSASGTLRHGRRFQGTPLCGRSTGRSGLHLKH